MTARGRKLIATTITPDRFSVRAAKNLRPVPQSSADFDDRLGEFSSARSEIVDASPAGDVHLFDPPADRPAVLVSCAIPDGNTGAANDDLGAPDRHRLRASLVAADAFSPAYDRGGTNTFFSIWHPELVHLRQDPGLPRHPAQIVLSRTRTWIRRTRLHRAGRSVVGP